MIPYPRDREPGSAVFRGLRWHCGRGRRSPWRACQRTRTGCGLANAAQDRKARTEVARQVASSVPGERNLGTCVRLRRTAAAPAARRGVEGGTRLQGLGTLTPYKPSCLRPRPLPRQPPLPGTRKRRHLRGVPPRAASKAANADCAAVHGTIWLRGSPRRLLPTCAPPRGARAIPPGPSRFELWTCSPPTWQRPPEAFGLEIGPCADGRLPAGQGTSLKQTAAFDAPALPSCGASARARSAASQPPRRHRLRPTRPARSPRRHSTAPAANSSVTRCGRLPGAPVEFTQFATAWMLRRASSDGTQGRTALDDRGAQLGRSSRFASSHSQDIDGVFSGAMDYGAVESSSSLIHAGSDVLGTEVPGLQDSSHDHELFEMLAAGKAEAGEAPQPRFLRWLPTWCGPLCLSLSIAGVLFLVSPAKDRARTRPRPRRLLQPCAPVLGVTRGAGCGVINWALSRHRVAPGLDVIEGNLTCRATPPCPASLALSERGRERLMVTPHATAACGGSPPPHIPIAPRVLCCCF